MKDSTKCIKGPATDWKKKFTTTKVTKDYYLQCIENSQKSTVKSQSNPIRKWTKDKIREQVLHKKDTQMAKEHMKKWSTLLVTW
jgi:hypothetical protein